MRATAYQLLATAVLGLSLAACSSNTATSETAAGSDAAAPVLTPGPWRGALATQGQEIPFLFDVETVGGKSVVYLRNGEERLKLDEITTAGAVVQGRPHRDGVCWHEQVTPDLWRLWAPPAGCGPRAGGRTAAPRRSFLALRR